ncbi:isochorismate synthase MenF [Rahnella bonaserana]|uniref:isochorismate synthase MenF n=1 Tax=Rahnella bonaserana TaxID=2816248 RepID=UPI0024C38918|nr:isochorismate synthase MenF [Rahnella bonaserana]MCL9642246.1 isochorismate synthase MenF [Rahnella victoriana]WHZ41928.1 isochorismate synthase MenF [Rahnella bonaserana]
MKQISAIIEQLDTTLAGEWPDTAGIRQFSYSLQKQPDTGLLEWLSAQPCYPKFYWQQRDGNEEAAVCGDAYAFGDTAQAQAFIREHQDVPDLHIWGLNAFNGADSSAFAANALFLPRIELCRQGSRYWLRCTLFSARSLREEARRTRLFLRSLVVSQALPPITSRVLQHQHLPAQPQWNQLITRALNCIEAQQFDKVVLARKTTLTLSQPLNACAFLAASRAVNHHCYHFMLAFTPQQAFLGSSPERLFLRNHDELYTEALAGTVANDPDDFKAQQLGDWLLNDGKNQRENLLVVDDICQRLQGGAQSLDIMPAEILRLRKVQHLRRSIHGELTDSDDAGCLQRLQPTAAVAGLPRQAAREFIAEFEPFDREWYAGSAGYISAEQTEFTVALRSAAVKGHHLELYAGAGIVAGSDAAQEWQEIENKAAGLRTLLEEHYTPAVQAG